MTVRRSEVAPLPLTATRVTPATPSKAEGGTASAKTTSISRTALPVRLETSSRAMISPFADEGHAIADALHLGQHVRREKDGLPGVAGLVDERVELVLHERIEAGRRLVQDEQLRAVHEGRIRPSLRLLPLDRSATFGRGRSRAARSSSLMVPLDAAAQVGEVAQRLATGERGIEASSPGR